MIMYGLIKMYNVTKPLDPFSCSFGLFLHYRISMTDSATPLASTKTSLLALTSGRYTMSLDADDLVAMFSSIRKLSVYHANAHAPLSPSLLPPTSRTRGTAELYYSQITASSDTATSYFITYCRSERPRISHDSVQHGTRLREGGGEVLSRVVELER